MNLYEIGKLSSRASKRRGERLPHFDRFTELLANEVNKVWLANNEAVVGVYVTAGGSRIVPQARSETAGGCAAKRPKIYHGTFAGVVATSQLVEQLALFQAEQAQGIATS